MKNIYKKFWLMSILIASSGSAHAETFSTSTANQLAAAYFQALQKHDLRSINALLDDHVVIKVLWTQAEPAQTFTLTKADYIQQLKATWHFAAQETYAVKNVSSAPVGNAAVVSAEVTENRLLFGNKAGAHNDLKISFTGDNSNPHITAISNKVEFW